MKALGTLAIAALALALGCSDDSTADPPAQVGNDVQQDAGAADGASADAAEQGDGSGNAADVAPGPEPLMANIFMRDPVTDEGKLTKVKVTKPTTPDGTLTSPWVEVRNCLNIDGGPPLVYSGIQGGSMCVEKQTLKAGSFGDYLYVKPPKSYSDPNDGFAELMMYHHVNRMHDYFKDVHGLKSLDFPIHALVNIQIKINETAAMFLQRKPGWISFPNAAFIPKESGQQIPFLPPQDEDAIMFMQHNDVDFAYETSVIYHEYTHAMVGTTRLNGAFPDLYGLNNLPGAMNEGFADYFAASMNDHPVIGAYALAAQGAHYVRKLTDKRICPNDLTTEIHADGKIIGSAMWAIREAIGKQKADSIILAAIQSFGQTTEFQGAGNAIVSEASKQDAASVPAVEKVLKEYGILGCDRVKPMANWSAMGSADKVPITVEGMQNGQQGKLPDGMPGYIQHSIEVPAGSKGVQITYVAQGSGGFGGFGASKPELSLAIQHNGPVMLGGFTGRIQSKFIVPGTADKALPNGSTVTLTGKCLPKNGGKIVLLFLNKGGTAAITQTFVSVLKYLDGKEINPTDCPK